jgi:hypothetical protein
MHLNNCNLGEIGKLRLKTCLASGKLLSRHVLARTDINAGTVFAAGFDVPDNLEPSSLEYGYVGGDVSQTLASAASVLEILHRIDSDFDTTFVLVENDLARPDVRAIVNRPVGSIIIFEGVVYHWKPLAELQSPGSFVEFLGSSSSGYPLNAFIVKAITRQEIFSAFAQRRVSQIIEKIESIINSIFDNDGFSIWVPDRLLAFHY